MRRDRLPSKATITTNTRPALPTRCSMCMSFLWGLRNWGGGGGRGTGPGTGGEKGTGAGTGWEGGTGNGNGRGINERKFPHTVPYGILQLP
jgi:hypothetical protein